MDEACAVIPPRGVVITGCSGGGKSTLIAEMDRRGWATVAEPGRRVVSEELTDDGKALPWVNLRAFADRAYAMALDDLAQAESDRWTLFDRGLIDAAVAREHAGGPAVLSNPLLRGRYHPVVFFAPPWPEIYAADRARRHDLADAIAESERLADAYPVLGYRLVELPRVSVAERADFIAAILEP